MASHIPPPPLVTREISKPMSEYVPKSPETILEPAEEDLWHVAFEEFKERDEKMVKDYQEEIDTLLVFAGLFSAVLTAFVVESYQSLQADQAQMSLDVLKQISRQLADPSLPAAPDQVPFHAERSNVQVNVCWFVSLLFSLVVALFGIFLKQWMRSYMKWTDVTPERDAVSLRQFRYCALESWRLGAILALLPTLLQLALILFLSGLLVFLWNLDRMVADVMVVLSSIVFFLVATVTVLPIISRSCPYRSPLSEVVALPLWHAPRYFKIVGSVARAFVDAGWTYSPHSTPWTDHSTRRRDWSESALLTSWKQADKGTVAQYNRGTSHITTHGNALVHLCCTTQSPRLWLTAITAIDEEYPNPSALASTKFFHYGVWWPVLDQIFSFHKGVLGTGASNQPQDVLRAFRAASSQWESFSPTMKQRWTNFLLHWNDAVCENSVPNSVVASYLLFCVMAMNYRRSGRCVLALMEVLAHHHSTLHVPHLQVMVLLLLSSDNSWQYSPVQWGQSGAEFIKASNDFSSKLADAIHGGGSMSKEHWQLLDILAQLACQAALGHMKEPHADVPEDLKSLLVVLERLHISCSDYQSFGIAPSCTRQLIFVARKEPGIFPKPLARAMVHQIDPGLLLQELRSTTTAEALDLSTVDVKHIESTEFRQSSHPRTIAALNCLIQPHLFTRVLDAYEHCLNKGTLRQPISSVLLGGVGQLTAQAGLAFVYDSV